jgi:predicted nucleic acid-binding protein
MPAVSNTSPLLNLAIIDRLSLLRQQFGLIQIPTAVLGELRVNESLPGSLLLRKAMEDGWIQVLEVSDRRLVQLLQQNLDPGEAEAIALAVELEPAWTLLDEREGRRVARALGLNITGVVGVLLRGWREGDIPSVSEAIAQLRTFAGFHIAPAFLAEVLKETGEIES